MYRIIPSLPASAYKTYRILAPKSTHHRPATCREVGCAASERGWQTTIDTATDLGARQANYIRLHSGRHFTVTEIGTMAVFTFPAGQKCFAEHTVPLDRPEIYKVHGGDWRGMTGGFQHANSDDWVDDFANHQDKLKTDIERG